MKILFLPKHEYLGASSRYRTLQYLPYIEQQNIDFDVAPLFSDEYLKYKYKHKKENKLITLKRILKRVKTILFSASKYDILLIEKELIPYFPPFLEYYLKYKNIPYVVDYDDAVWHNYDNHRNLIVRKILKNKIKYVIKNASSVIAGSEYIVNYTIECDARKVIKIPTVIDTLKYKCKKIDKKSSLFIIGWIGSPSSSQYILDINSNLAKFTKKHNTVVHLVGFDKSLISKLSFNYKIIDWTNDDEIKEISQFDIGIMPLPNTLFEKGKCGFKLIQYMGCKKPVIADAVGENRFIIDCGINGYLIKDNKEWDNYLEILYNDKNRDRFGLCGYKKVKEKYSLEKNQEKYLKSIIGVLNENINDL